MNQRNHLFNTLVFPLFSLLLLVHFRLSFHQFITHRFYEVLLYNQIVFANRYWVNQKRLNLDHCHQLLPHLMALFLYLVTIRLNDQVAAFIIWLLAFDFQLEFLVNLLARLLRDPSHFLIDLLLL